MRRSGRRCAANAAGSASGGELAEEAQRAGVEGGRQPLQEQPAIEPGEHADGQEEPGPAGDPTTVRRQAAARHDAVHMRVMEQVLSPGVQHGDHAGLGAEVLGIGGDGAHRLGRRLEQDVVDDRLVLQGDRGDRRRHGEHDVEVRDRQQLGLSVGEPLRPSQALAFGAVPVAAGIVGDADLAAVGALLDMAAERRRAARLDGAHDPTLPVGQGGGVCRRDRRRRGGGRCPPPRARAA